MEARGTLLELREVILQVCGLDPSTEPVPLVGRSPRCDVVNLVAYVGDLLRRAAPRAGGVQTVVERIIAEMPDRLDEALGA